MEQDFFQSMMNWLIGQSLGGFGLSLPNWTVAGISLGTIIGAIALILQCIEMWKSRSNASKQDVETSGDRVIEATTETVEETAEQLADKIDDASKTTLAEIEALRRDLLGDRESQPMSAETFAEAFSEMLNDPRGEFAPARLEAEAALTKIRQGDDADAEAEFDRALHLFKSSLAQRAEMRAQIAKEEAKDYRRLGALAYDREPQTALEAYREAAKLDDSDFGTWIYLSRLEDRQAGSVQAALEAAEKAKTVATSEREKSVALNDFGDIAMKAGRTADAQSVYKGSLEIARALMASNEGSAEANRDVCVSLNNLGDARLQGSDLSGAVSSYEESLEVARALMASNEGSAEAKRDVSVSLDRLGDARLQGGDLSGAVSSYEESLEMRRALMASNESSAEAKRDVSLSLDRLGDARLQGGDLSGAVSSYEESLEMRRALMASNPGSAEAKRDVWVSMWRIAHCDSGKISWDEVASAIEAMAEAGTLAPVDQEYLDQARANAAAEKSAGGHT